MMIVAKDRDKERILQYLKVNVQECLYLYIDITNYGIASPNMRVWYSEEDGELSLVAMKYYDSYQIYSHKTGYGMDEFYQLFKENPATMISGRKDLIEQLEKKMPDYTASYGIVFRGYPYERTEDRVFSIVRATEEDASDIAGLLCSSRSFSSQYTVEVLQAQLAERIRTGTGRSYIARAEDTNELIGHIATYAETEDVAIISGSMVASEYRKTDLFSELDNYICCQLGKENKSIFAFSTIKKLTYIPKLLQNDCGEYGKLVKKK